MKNNGSALTIKAAKLSTYKRRLDEQRFAYTVSTNNDGNITITIASDSFEKAMRINEAIAAAEMDWQRSNGE